MLPTIIGLLDNDTRFHMISVQDIAWFAADVFEHPEEFIGKELDVAGDVLTPGEMKSIYRKVTGRRLPPVSKTLMRLMIRLVNPESARQFKWNNQQGWTFDIAPLRQRHPGLTSFEQFLRNHYEARG